MAAAVAFLCFGCAHVPREAVQLSYQIGQDLPRLHESFDSLIHDRFEDFRAQRNGYVDEVWAPTFLGRWIEEGKLVAVARGETVWSFDTESFAAPTPGKAKAQLLATIQEWSQVAIAQIEMKRHSLIDPLDQEEDSLRSQVREAFTRMVQANSYITAHLASLKHVEDAQDEALQALRLKDLRDSIDRSLKQVSENARTGLEAVRRLDGLVEKASRHMSQPTEVHR